VIGYKNPGLLWQNGAANAEVQMLVPLVVLMAFGLAGGSAAGGDKPKIPGPAPKYEFPDVPSVQGVFLRDALMLVVSIDGQAYVQLGPATCDLGGEGSAAGKIQAFDLDGGGYATVVPLSDDLAAQARGNAAKVAEWSVHDGVGEICRGKGPSRNNPIEPRMPRRPAGKAR